MATTTFESLKAYKEAGFNVLYLNYVMAFSGLYFADPTVTSTDNQYTTPSKIATAKVKEIMGWAAELGLKCILTEGDIYTLSCSKSSLIVTDGSADGKRTFASQEALNAYVYERMKDVMKHEAFYGFCFDDEPTYIQFEPMGQLATAIRAACPTAYVMINLYGYGEGSKVAAREYYMAKADAQALIDTYGDAAYPMIYRNYLDLYYTHLIEKAGLTDIRYDDYPLHEERESFDAVIEGEPYYAPTEDAGSTIGTMHLKTAVIVAEFCKEKGLTFAKVFQTMGGHAIDEATPSNSKIWRTPTKDDMYWQMHIGMAMGIKDFSYWTYYPVINMGNVEEYYHDSTFVDFAGNKNDLYYWLQEIHAEMRSTATALSWFDFVAAHVYENGELGSRDFVVNGIEENAEPSVALEPVLENEGAVLVTELYDDYHDKKGFWFVNVTDPYEKASQTVTATFEEYEYLYVYQNGVASKIYLDENSAATFELACGQGVFVIPF